MWSCDDSNSTSSLNSQLTWEDIEHSTLGPIIDHSGIHVFVTSKTCKEDRVGHVTVREVPFPCLQEQRAATRENVERRMARTADELLEDQQQEEAEEEEVESEEEEDEVPYNPKNLPLGWDGKVGEGGTWLGGVTYLSLPLPLSLPPLSLSLSLPLPLLQPIPYWLYKLHGLNITYSCEICGNATYRGPKAFQRHFSVS